jgi:outer membrane protein assembly factor BamB
MKLYSTLLWFSCLHGPLGRRDCHENPWQPPGALGIYASPLGAAGRVYLPGRNGVTVVLKQSDKLEVLATNRLDEKFDASPAAAGKDLFLRGREYLYCLTEK